MSRLGNKGQALVIFVIFVPVFIIVGAFMVDLTFAQYNEREINDIAQIVIDYGLDHLDGEPYTNMVDLIYQNDDGVDDYSIEIDEENQRITLSISKSTKGFFGRIIGKEIYKESCSYVGYLKDDKKIIEKGV